MKANYWLLYHTPTHTCCCKNTGDKRTSFGLQSILFIQPSVSLSGAPWCKFRFSGTNVIHCYRVTVNKSEITLIDKEVVAYLNCLSAQRYNYPRVALIYFLESWRKSSTKALFCFLHCSDV